MKIKHALLTTLGAIGFGAAASAQCFTSSLPYDQPKPIPKTGASLFVWCDKKDVISVDYYFAQPDSLGNKLNSLGRQPDTLRNIPFITVNNRPSPYILKDGKKPSTVLWYSSNWQKPSDSCSIRESAIVKDVYQIMQTAREVCVRNPHHVQQPETVRLKVAQNFQALRDFFQKPQPLSQAALP